MHLRVGTAVARHEAIASEWASFKVAVKFVLIRSVIDALFTSFKKVGSRCK